MILVRQSCLVACGLLAVGCGGATDDAHVSHMNNEGATQMSALAPARDDRAFGADSERGTARRATDPVPLRDWLARLSDLHRVAADAEPKVAAQPVMAALPSSKSGDELVAALADFDLLLGYTRREGQRAELTSVHVMPRGGLASRPATHPGMPGPLKVATPETDPAQALQRIQQDLASSDPAVRGAALARSFELEAPLPAPTLEAALRGDASGDVRLYALMALARHPAIAPSQLRALAQVAVFDADPAVRAHAAEVAGQLDAAERAK